MDCLCEPSLRHNPFLCNATFLTAARLCGFQPPAAFMTRGARTSSVTPSTGLLSSPTDGCANETVLSVHDEKPRPTSGQPRLVVVHGKDAQSNPSEPPRREDEQLSRETWSSQTKLSEWLAGYMPPHRPHLPLEARVAMRAVLKKYIRSRFKSLRSSSSPSHQPWWKRLIDELLSKEHPRQQHLFWRQVLTIDSDHPVSRDQYAFRVAHHWLEARIESLVHARPNEKELSQSCEKELGLMCKDFGTLIGERNGVFEHFGATCLYFLTSMLLLPLSQLSLSWGKTSVAGDMPPPVWSDTPDDDDDADVDGELKKLKEVHQPPVFEDKPQRPTDVFTAWHDWHGRCTRRLLQEFLSQSLGYVFLTERIKLFFTPLWRRLLFSAFTFLSFAVVAFFPMAMQMD
ncbi:hypothetical protein MMC34_008347, partial [Xylographa carneopallida]|nr:hypothetical protein [Xylographa carneopallida]